VSITFLDCTLRDGGYYNEWNFPKSLIEQYIGAMQGSGVSIVEIGFRSLLNTRFKGSCAFSSDGFIRSLTIPPGVSIGVMVNGSELVGQSSQKQVLARLFPEPARSSPVDLVRIACHAEEFSTALLSAQWLKEMGYRVGFNLMQVSGLGENGIKELARKAADSPIDVLYFADSLGSMSPSDVAKIIEWIKAQWGGEIGIHTHDNMGLALANAIRALDEGATWVDATVTGMGRGPGNASTEELAIDVADRRRTELKQVPLLKLINAHFEPMKEKYGWGKNHFYYLSGKYGIHPSYIQEMLADSRFSEEDVLAVIGYLKEEDSSKFSSGKLGAARNFYRDEPRGSWAPKDIFSGREVLLLGTGPGVKDHREALEEFIKARNPLVLALNRQDELSADAIDYRVACHPIRLLADCRDHLKFPQPLITPLSGLTPKIHEELKGKNVLDFGLQVEDGRFEFGDTFCVVPNSLVMTYAFALASSGQASVLYLAGFDGYPGEDQRNDEANRIIADYLKSARSTPLVAVTPSRYDVSQKSIYGEI
jgi:4-hydroxy 2-oxovalerate aldolase